MKLTITKQDIRCNNCGQYEPQCSICKKIFDTNENIFCNGKEKHYCKKCYNKK